MASLLQLRQQHLQELQFAAGVHDVLVQGFGTQVLGLQVLINEVRVLHTSSGILEHDVRELSKNTLTFAVASGCSSDSCSDSCLVQLS